MFEKTTRLFSVHRIHYEFKIIIVSRVYTTYVDGLQKKNQPERPNCTIRYINEVFLKVFEKKIQI